jgi:hypothetical protein
MTGATLPIERQRGLLKPINFGKNGLFDITFVILGGMFLYLPIFWCLGEATVAKNVPFDWAFWASQIISMPHVWATYARLGRKTSEKKIHWLFGFPCYAAIVGILALATLKGFFLQVMTAVNVWQTFHYLRQTYGVGRYFGRDSMENDLERRLFFWAYHLAVPMFVFGRWNMLYVVWRGKPSDAIIPVSFPEWFLFSCIGLACIGFGLGVYLEVRKYRRASAQGYDATNLLNLICYYAMHWYGFMCMAHYVIGFISVTIFHGVQYMAIVWRFEVDQKTTNGFQTKALRGAPALISFVLFITALFFIGDTVQSKVFMFFNTWWAPFAGVALSSISAHHYLVDTKLWGRRSGL